MPLLAVNISLGSLLRQAKVSREPEPATLAAMAVHGGADAVSLHVREQREHLNDRDIRILRQTLPVPMFLRMAATTQMTGLALETKPDLVTLIAEKPQKLGIDGGIDLIVYRDAVAEAILILRDSGIPVCLSVDPDPEQVKIAYRLDADAVEIFTGGLTRASEAASRQLMERIDTAIGYAARLKMGIHAGGGLDYPALKRLTVFERIDWFCLGHSILSRALATGMAGAVADAQRTLGYRHPVE
jgi:pyridoxine 5-phosphate synthase